MYKNNLTRFYLSVLFIVLVFGSYNCVSTDVRPSNMDSLDLQGHRGARGLKPENTWPAFETAIQYGMTTLELDTVLTKDGAVIVHHDSDTNPTICQKKDGSPIEKKSLYDLTLNELKELDCGTKKNPNFPEQSPVPGTELITIQEFFKMIKKEEAKNPKLKKLLFNIETKFPQDNLSTVSKDKMKSHVDALVLAIEKSKMVDRTTIQSFYLPALPYAKEVNPKIKTSALFAPTYFQGFMMVIGMGDSYREEILTKTKSVQANIVSPYFLYVNSDFMNQSRDKKILVIPWTVNDKKEMKRLISIGVNGIISDYPNRLIEVVEEYKKQNNK